MYHTIFFLVEDKETGDIIDSALQTQGEWPLLQNPDSFIDAFMGRPNAEAHLRELCQMEGWKLLDYDGPYAAPFFMTSWKKKPRWESLIPPAGIDPERWQRRRRSTK